jgi:hypothetical protein
MPDAGKNNEMKRSHQLSVLNRNLTGIKEAFSSSITQKMLFNSP